MVVALVHVGVPLKIKDNNRSIGKSVFSYGLQHDEQWSKEGKLLTKSKQER